MCQARSQKFAMEGAVLGVWGQSSQPTEARGFGGGAFEITFLQEPRNQQKLDVLESMWINKLVAEININKTILPKHH